MSAKDIAVPPLVAGCSTSNSCCLHHVLSLSRELSAQSITATFVQVSQPLSKTSNRLSTNRALDNKQVTACCSKKFISNPDCCVPQIDSNVVAAVVQNRCLNQRLSHPLKTRKRPAWWQTHSELCNVQSVTMMTTHRYVELHSTLTNDRPPRFGCKSAAAIADKKIRGGRGVATHVS
jgi:hypothetical protein